MKTKCEICNKRKGVIKTTQMIRGRNYFVRVCRKCYDNYKKDEKNDGVDIDDFGSGFFIASLLWFILFIGVIVGKVLF